MSGHWHKQKETERRSTAADWWARIPAFIALAVSVSGFLLAYESALPSLAGKAQFVDPLVVGQNFTVKIDIDNNGNTTARHMEPDLRFGIAAANVDFKPFVTGQTINAVPADWKPTVSDLGPKGHTAIVTMNQMALGNDAAVKGITSGITKLYVYGRIPYEDVLHIGHEFHFCFFYQQTPGIDPLEFLKCTSYNETD